MMKHIPVLLDSVMRAAGDVANARVLDATFGAGGYSRAFLDAGAIVTAFDRDPTVIGVAEKFADEFGVRFRFVPKRFSSMAELDERFDVIVFDLGISSMQIDDAARGFSFRADAPLDMRMSIDGPTIVDMFDVWTVDDLTKILRNFGDVRPAHAIACAIKDKMPQTTFELKGLIHNPRDIAPVFQALRIALNDEIGEITRALDAVPGLLNVGGRCICVTFHSIEDRIVKNTFRDWTMATGDARMPVIETPRFELMRAQTPTDAELEKNPRARSAHMRGVIKLC
ncbi:MAG: 16S rRNA (cytosine(1402)-N(4))-methyltransferase RsmH [Alphaproteobacteria bacterium]|nr:16S rRNA (cytosine(1402)-N(4))-methyltransferase RsmH [Alphaproteobacteria bacterium]